MKTSPAGEDRVARNISDRGFSDEEDTEHETIGVSEEAQYEDLEMDDEGTEEEAEEHDEDEDEDVSDVEDEDGQDDEDEAAVDGEDGEVEKGDEDNGEDDRGDEEHEERGENKRQSSAVDTSGRKGRKVEKVKPAKIPVLPWMRVPVSLGRADLLPLESVPGLDSRIARALRANGMRQVRPTPPTPNPHHRDRPLTVSSNNTHFLSPKTLLHRSIDALCHKLDPQTLPIAWAPPG